MKLLKVSLLPIVLAMRPPPLIAARTVQGVGAALMNPATLSIITATSSVIGAIVPSIFAPRTTMPSAVS